MSEACASNALSIASKSIDAADVRLRAVVDRLNKTTVSPTGVFVFTKAWPTAANVRTDTNDFELTFDATDSSRSSVL